MVLRLRHVCWVIILAFIAGPSHAGQRETIRSLEFAAFRIDLLPFEFRIPRYELTHCERDSYSDIEVIEARIEKPNGETWAHVYQMLPPEDGGSVTCGATELNVHEYCYRKRLPQASRGCGTKSIVDLSIEVYRIKPNQDTYPEHLYAIIDGTLVVFAFADEKEEARYKTGEVLEAMESMTRVTPTELLNHRDEGAGGELWALLKGASAKKHVDQIPFSKLLPDPLPSGFDRIEGSAYWNMYALSFRTDISGEHSGLGIQFWETKRFPRLKTCWPERTCELVATTSKSHKIYSRRTNLERYPDVPTPPSPKAPTYYVDIEGTLVTLSWLHWTRSEGEIISRSHEFAPNELETLVDSLEIATSGDLVRFPNMSVMGYWLPNRGGEFSTQVRVVSIPRMMIVQPPAKTDCIRVHDDGSVERVGNPDRRQGGLRHCEP
jgi:hypothetical protein